MTPLLMDRSPKTLLYTSKHENNKGVARKSAYEVYDMLNIVNKKYSPRPILSW